MGGAPALPAYGRSGIRHTGGLSLEEAVGWNVGTLVSMLTEKSQVAGTTSARVRMRHPCLNNMRIGGGDDGFRIVYEFLGRASQ